MSGTPQARSAYFIGSQSSCQICSRKHSNIRSHVYFPPDSFHRLQSLNRTVVTSLMQYTSNARSAKQYKPTQTYDVRRMRTIKTGIVRTSNQRDDSNQRNGVQPKSFIQASFQMCVLSNPSQWFDQPSAQRCGVVASVRTAILVSVKPTSKRRSM